MALNVPSWGSMKDHDWIKMVEFGETSLKFNEEKDKVISSLDIYNVSESADDMPRAKNLQEILVDYEVFTLAPVYVGCSVPFDIFGEFRATMEAAGTPYTGPRLSLRFKEPIFAGLGDWNYMLEAMPLGDDFKLFSNFMTTQSVRKKELGEYWKVYKDTMLIMDPLDVDNHVVKDESAMPISAFLPTGNKCMYVQDLAVTQPQYTFKRAVPDPAIVTEAQVLLNV